MFAKRKFGHKVTYFFLYVQNKTVFLYILYILISIKHSAKKPFSRN